MQSIDELKKYHKEQYGDDNSVMDVHTLCKSLSGLTIPIITITEFIEDATKAVPLDSRKIIII